MAFGDEFIRMIQPFVYQRYLDGVTLTEIKVRAIFKRSQRLRFSPEDGLDIAVLLSEEDPQQLEAFLSRFRFEM
ncbi:hypothetical protein GBAR_LOCUS19226 [Geodia barretti]|uniref:Uncharacterized protein n=1 Tax=Geodia barretti TaxID=519541 RepID=A0AA35SRS8_GEOBA|nr:hypothetical protein GBAR_LOCUS19226 [Geodia barretti]